jgi:hypothetical protein
MSIISILALTIIGFGGQDFGTTAFSLLRVGYGARPAALGDAYVALSNDGSGIWWNPAGVAWLDHSEAFLSHHNWFAGIRDEIAGIAYGFNGWGCGTSVVYSGTDHIETWSNDNFPVAPEVEGASAIIHVVCASQWREKIAYGLAVKCFYDKLVDVMSLGAAVDIGMQCRITDRICIGGVVQNVGKDMVYESMSFPLPLTSRIGGCVEVLPGWWNLLMDMEWRRYGFIDLHVGSELTYKIGALRCGYRSGPQDTELGCFTFGAGVQVESILIDFAYVPYGDLGNTYRIWIAMKFGEPPAPDPLKPDNKIED